MAATDPRVGLVVLGAGLFATLGARADTRYATSVHGYTDSDSLEVLHPHVTARTTVEDTTFGLSWDADVISAATIDVRTSASPRGFSEMRNGFALDLDHAASSTVHVGASGVGSVSPDYASATGSAHLALEDELHIHRVSLSGTGSWSSVGRVGDQRPVGEAWAAGGALAWSWVLTRDLVLDVAGAIEHAHGYLESPYRFVSIYAAGDPSGRVAVPESVPDDRTRGSGRVGLRLAASDALVLRGAYRLHADDWGVLGHTAYATLTVIPIPELRVSLDVRYLGQRGASFYSGHYATLPLVPDLRTRDRELAPMSTMAGALRLEVDVGTVEGLRATLLADAELAYTRYLDTPLLPERLAFSAGLGVAFTR